MAVVVLVHGIDQHEKLPGEVEREWLPAFAAGLRRAGYTILADRVWHRESGRGDLDVRMAFYGNLFLRRDQQGDDAAIAAPMKPIADLMAQEWLERAALRASDAKQKETAVRELAHATGQVGQEPQWTGAAIRTAVNGLSRLRFFAPTGMSFGARFVNRALSQVTGYIGDPGIREAAQQSVLDLIGPETKVILAHSLGTVVAFEALHRLSHPLPLFITAGSPLGLRTIIYQQLRPQPVCFPRPVRRWVNVVDNDDFIAAQPNLTNLFGAGIPGDAVFEGCWTVDNRASPHDARFYLEQIEIGRPAGAALASTDAERAG